MLVSTCLIYAIEAIVVNILVFYNSKIITTAEEGDANSAIRVGSVCVMILLVDYLLVIIGNYTRLLSISNGEIDCKKAVFRSIMRRPISSFRGENDAFYLGLLTTDVDLYREEYLDCFPFVFNALAAIGSSVFFLVRINFSLLIGAIIMATISLLISRPFKSKIQKYKLAYSNKSQEYMNVLREGIEAHETIVINSGKDEYEEKYYKSCTDKQLYWRKYNFYSKVSFSTLLSTAGLSAIVCLMIGAYLVANNTIKAGMLIATMNYFTSLSNHISNFMANYISIRSNKPIKEKLYGQSQMDYGQKDEINGFIPKIKVKELTVSFSNKVVYKNFNYEFLPFKCYSIIGESGCGKSTLLKMILKYSENYTGSIEISDRNIREISDEDFYGRIAYVEQSPYIFNASIKDNITLFSQDNCVDKKLYEEVLKKVGLASLEKKYKDETLGDMGDKVSGGEKQRINIARALYKKPSIILFDEPVSGLDPENQLFIENLIFELKDITRIVVTHNWDESYLKRFDDVIEILG